MASTSEEPRRGEVWLVSLGAGRSREPAKNRPAIVVSVDQVSTGAPEDLIVVVPVSSSSAPSPLRPEVEVAAGLERRSHAICGAVRGVARTRLLQRLGTLGPAKLEEVERALAMILGLTSSGAADASRAPSK